MDFERHILPPPGEYRVVALLKSDTGEKYTFVFEDNENGRKRFLLTLGRYASNPELSFNWNDAGKLAGSAK